MKALQLIAIGILLAGGILCALSWRLGRRWPVWVRLLPASLIAAFTLAPGVVVGHGIAIGPVLVVFLGTLCAGEFSELFNGAVRPVIVQWATIYMLAVIVVVMSRLARKRRKVFWAITGLVTAALLSLVPLGSIVLRERVRSIDLRTIYTGLQDFNEGRGGYVHTTGEYPSGGFGTTYYHMDTPRGSITLNFGLVEQPGWWTSNLHQWEVAKTSQPIGDLSFFWDFARTGETLELAYQRYNVACSFRDSPHRAYRGGRPVIELDADKKEMEDTAKILDRAIMRRDPGIKFEEIRLGRVIHLELTKFLSSYFWIFSFIAAPGR